MFMQRTMFDRWDEKHDDRVEAYVLDALGP